MLDGELRLLRVRGCTVSLTGSNGRAGLGPDHDYSEPREHGADLRILLCHYPWVHERLAPGAFQLVLSGHMHGGQICVPLPAGRIPLAHPTARHIDGTYVRDGCTMHVSPGLGTTFVGLRVLARPEATLLVLRRLP